MTISTFPSLPGLTYPALRTPTWATDKEQTISGKRARYALRNVPIWQWELPFSFLRTSTQYAEWQSLVSFFNGLYGAQGLFEFRDDEDYAAVDQSFGQGDGVSTAFQLTRTGPTAAGTFTENVYAPSTVTSVSVAGTTLTSTQYSLSTGGIVNFSSGAPANGDALVWSGEFNWLCRMTDDSLELSRFTATIYDLKSLKFESEIL